MATQRLMYIELKSRHGDCGPAWIGNVIFSRSGRTIYFNGMALKRRHEGDSNHYDLKTGDAYWVSGVKKNGCDRHWAGTGPIMIDARVVDEHLAFRGLKQLDPMQHQITHDIRDTDIAELHDIENEPR